MNKDFLKQVSEITKRIDHLQAETTRLDGEIGRCTTTIAAADTYSDRIAILKRRRDEALAQAFVDKSEADTTAMDTEIAAAEAQGVQALADGRTAQVATEVIATRVIEMQAEASTLNTQRNKLVASEVELQRETAIDKYVQLVEEIGQVVADFVAADRLMYKVGAPSAGNGTRLLARIQVERLPIPWDRTTQTPRYSSARSYSSQEVAAAVSSFLDLEPILAAPAWMHDEAPILAAYEATAEKLRKAGIAI